RGPLLSRATRPIALYHRDHPVEVAGPDYLDPEADWLLSDADEHLEGVETHCVDELDADDPDIARRVWLARLCISLARRQIDRRPETLKYRHSNVYRIDAAVSDGLITRSEADALYAIFEG